MKGLSHPDSARRGMKYGRQCGHASAIAALQRAESVGHEWILVGVIIGSLIGGAIANFVPMTALPQQTALSHAFGAFAASLVGIAEFHRHGAELGRL